MDASELVENNVCAKDIRDKLLKALNLGPGEFATALGINYQRIYDLGSGRVKKFNPGMVNLICRVFPQVNPTFLYSGTGPVLINSDKSGGMAETSELISMSKKLIELMEQLNRKDTLLREREETLKLKEAELSKREKDIIKKEEQLRKRTESIAADE